MHVALNITQAQVVDSHTGGEPTRVVLSGGPDLGSGSLAERKAIFRERFDDFRSAVCNEPRGSDAMVGALLVEPTDPTCVGRGHLLQQRRLCSTCAGMGRSACW